MISNVIDYLDDAAEKKPDKIAIIDEEHEIQYAELQKKAKAIGTYLIQKYKVINKPVAVVIDRNIESLVMFFGVVYSGNFYVPIDLELPEERIKSMINTLQPSAIIGLNKDAESSQRYGEMDIYEEIVETQIDDDVLSKIHNKVIDTNPLYAVFTSGSTGVPKAVLISHRSVIDLTEQFKVTFGLKEDEIFGNQAPFDYDGSVKDIYSSLKSHGTICIIPKQFFFFPIKLIEYINKHRVTNLTWAATALCIVANLKAMKKIQPRYLRRVMFSGEVLPIKVLNYWKSYLPDIDYVNLYGPTEITCNCTYYKVDREYEIGEMLPIGHPFPNTEIVVLNDDNVLVSGDEIGELCVKGSCLALGYYNNPQKTSEVFCQNPLNKMYPEIIYRTGDMVKYDNEGRLVYCARKDFQIKHMGHRIELNEIELATSLVPDVSRSCCLYNHEKERIVLFYESEEKLDDIILAQLTKTLPKYMLPSQFVWLEKFPLNNSSKIDRVALRNKYMSD